MNTATSRYSAAWDSPKMMNSMKQHTILYSYSVHKKNLDNIKVYPHLKMVDNDEPHTYKLFPPSNSMQASLLQSKSKLNPLSTNKTKPEREKELVVDMENGSLINRMMQITEKGSQYNKSLIDKHLFKCEKTLNAPFRRKESHKVNTENLSLHNRLEKVSSTISFGTYEKSYKNTKNYKNNIMRASRRIFNCFVKTEQNQELIATTSTAYGRFSQPMSSTSKSSNNKISFGNGDNKKEELQNKNEDNQVQEEKQKKEQPKPHNFPEEDENQIHKSQGKDNQDEEHVNLSRNQSLHEINNLKEEEKKKQEGERDQVHEDKIADNKEKKEDQNHKQLNQVEVIKQNE